MTEASSKNDMRSRTVADSLTVYKYSQVKWTWHGIVRFITKD